jgi:hypothetical protein
MADPVFSSDGFLLEDSLFNTYLWENWGIRALDAVVVEFVTGAYNPTPLDAISAIIFDSPITAGVNLEDDPDSTTLLRLARAIDVSVNPPVNNGSAIMSSDYSYGETDLAALGLNEDYIFDENEDIIGPMTLVGFAFNADTNGRIVLIGDSDFAADGQIGSPPGNAQLFFGAMNWLTQFEESITFGFSQSAIAPPTIFVSPAQLDQVTFLVIFIIPGLMIALGTGIWFYRSRR